MASMKMAVVIPSVTTSQFRSGSRAKEVLQDNLPTSQTHLCACFPFLRFLAWILLDLLDGRGHRPLLMALEYPRQEPERACFIQRILKRPPLPRGHRRSAETKGLGQKERAGLAQRSRGEGGEGERFPRFLGAFEAPIVGQEPRILIPGAVKRARAARVRSPGGAVSTLPGGGKRLGPSRI